MAAASGLVASRKDFSNPVKDQTTFGYSPAKVNKNVFDRAYATEFRGKQSPPATTYQSNLDTFQFGKHDSKTLTRDPRVCPMVSKAQRTLQGVGPQTYGSHETNSSFGLNKGNSRHYGSRATRNIDPRQYAQANAKRIDLGIY